MRLPLYRPHSRTIEMADAFADGELSGREHVRFERHLAACVACAAAVEAARETKRLLAALPEYDAPRSFRLTPAMVREQRSLPKSPARSRVPALVFRASQATAGFAAAALAVVIIMNFPSSEGADDSALSQSAEAEKLAPSSAFTVAGAATAAATSAADAAETQPYATQSATVPPAPRTGGDGAGLPTAQSALSTGDVPSDDAVVGATPADDLFNSTTAGAADLRAPTGEAPLQILTDTFGGEAVGRSGNFPTLEVVLAGILVAAAGTAIAASRIRRRQS